MKWEKYLADVSEALDGLRFRGWEFWYVTVIGGYNPVEVAREWSMVDVFDSYFDLRVKSLVG